MPIWGSVLCLPWEGVASFYLADDNVGEVSWYKCHHQVNFWAEVLQGEYWIMHSSWLSGLWGQESSNKLPKECIWLACHHYLVRLLSFSLNYLNGRRRWALVVRPYYPVNLYFLAQTPCFSDHRNSAHLSSVFNCNFQITSNTDWWLLSH